MDNRTANIIKTYLQLDRMVSEKFSVSYGNRSLTIPQLLVLTELDASGPVQISLLAEKVGNANSTVSGIVDRLESAGLVRRTRCPGDRRIVFVETTDKFTAVKAELGGSVESYFDSLLSDCTPEELDTIENGLTVFNQKLSAKE